MQTIYLIISVIVLLLSLIITRVDWLSVIISQNDANFSAHLDKHSTDLLIGILSARNNFKNRLLLRKTWLTMARNSDLDVKYMFVVGKHPCLVPENERKDVYSCEKLNITAKNTEELHFSTETTDKQSYGLVYSALRFKVLQDVLLTKLGILASILTKFNGSAAVSVTDSSFQEEVANTRFFGGNYQVLGGFAYRPVENVVLRKGFEGVLRVENAVDVFGVENWSKFSDGGGIIQFDMVEDSQGVVKKISSDLHCAVSMGFKLHNLIPAKKPNMEKSEDENNLQLREEMKMYKDIELVDMIDVYQNLPTKLLEFAASSVENYSFRYFLKVDDDTFVHLHRVIQELQLSNNYNHTWFGRFRCNWVVERHGKWKEFKYPSVVYPCFACGSAYLLSQDLVHFVARNKGSLQTFQGEDVSMGIWLSTLPINFKQDDRWACAEGCNESWFIRGQLSPEKLHQTWKCLKKHQKICC